MPTFLRVLIYASTKLHLIIYFSAQIKSNANTVFFSEFNCLLFEYQ